MITLCIVLLLICIGFAITIGLFSDSVDGSAAVLFLFAALGLEFYWEAKLIVWLILEKGILS